MKSIVVDLFGQHARPGRGRPSRKRGRVPRTHCSDCSALLTDDNAYRRVDSAIFRSRCRDCLKTLRRARHDEDEDRRRAKLNSTNCAICGAAETVTRGGRIRRPTIDHDHRTGFIRGILCSRCNAGLGLFRDRPDLLRAAAQYLDLHRQRVEGGEPMELHR